MDRLYENFNKLLKATSTDFIRYKYTEINWDSHMLGLVGPRGVGKTTMFLQHIKQNMNPKDTLASTYLLMKYTNTLTGLVN